MSCENNYLLIMLLLFSGVTGPQILIIQVMAAFYCMPPFFMVVVSAAPILTNVSYGIFVVCKSHGSFVTCIGLDSQISEFADDNSSGICQVIIVEFIVKMHLASLVISVSLLFL